MRRILLLILLLMLFVNKVHAADLIDQQADRFGVGELEKNLPSAASTYLDEVTYEGLDFTEGVSEIISGTLSQSGGYIHASVSLLLKILLILILCRLAATGDHPVSGKAITMAGVLAMTVCCASDLRSMIGLGKQTMQEMMDFSTLLLPVMASTAAASGAAASASVLYGIAVLFSKILVGFSGKVMIPAIYAYLALGVADGAMGEAKLLKLREFLGWLIKWGLKAVMYLFTGYMAVSGLLSGHVDATALKAAKVTVSGMVPVVGGIISDAAETVLYSAGLLKGAVGTFGMLAVFAVFASPFLKMGLHYLSFKLTAALGGVLGSSLCGFMDCITQTMGYLLAMLGSCALMCWISCCCFMKAVGL